MSAPPDLHVIDKPPADGSEGPRVVIVHGAMDRSASFGRVGRHLRDLHLVRYDRRGYGESAALGTGTLDEHVEDLLGVLDGRPATVFGHSIGGVIALVAAQRAAGPGAVACSPTRPPTPWAPWWPQPKPRPARDPADEAEAFMRRAIGDHFWNRLPARTREARPAAEGPALLADLASLRGAPRTTRPGSPSRCSPPPGPTRPGGTCAPPGSWPRRCRQGSSRWSPAPSTACTSPTRRPPAQLVRRAVDQAAVASAGHVPDP